MGEGAMMRTLLTFRSRAFNTTEDREHFINPGNYGEDLARWIVDRLAQRGIRAGPEIGQEDHGWYFRYWVGDRPYTLVVGYRPGDGESEGDWVGWVERDVGFIASLLGRRTKGIEGDAVRVLHDALSDAPEVVDLRWHEPRAFRAGEEEGSPTP